MLQACLSWVQDQGTPSFDNPGKNFSSISHKTDPPDFITIKASQWSMVVSSKLLIQFDCPQDSLAIGVEGRGHSYVECVPVSMSSPRSRPVKSRVVLPPGPCWASSRFSIRILFACKNPKRLVHSCFWMPRNKNSCTASVHCLLQAFMPVTMEVWTQQSHSGSAWHVTCFAKCCIASPELPDIGSCMRATIHLRLEEVSCLATYLIILLSDI